MPLTFLSTLDILFVFLALFILRAFLRRLTQVASLPPGPKGLPLVGNVLDMPAEKEWLTFARWGETWGGGFELISQIAHLALVFYFR